MLVRFFNALDIRAEIGESSIFAFHLSPPAFDLRFHLASAMEFQAPAGSIGLPPALTGFVTYAPLL